MLHAGRTVLAKVGVLTILLALAAQCPGQTVASQPAPPETGGEANAPAAAEAIKPLPSGAFNFNCKDLDLRLALRLLGAQTRKNIICTKDVSGTVTVDLYAVTFKEALDALLRIGGYAYREKDNFIWVMTVQQLADAIKAEQKLVVRAFRLGFVTAADAQTLIKPALSTEGSVAVTPAALAGIATSKTDTGGVSMAANDVIVVRDYEENIEKVAKILQDLDIRPDQVLVEATILRATLTEDNQLGIDFNALSGVDFAEVSTVTDPSSLQALTTGAFANASKQALQVRTGTNADVGNGGITFGFTSNNIALFIKALETVTDVTVVANPKLLIVNKQRGEVLIGDHTGYLTTTVTETVATQTVQFLDGGTRLIVRPFIAKDGYIRMEIHPEDSTNSTQTISGTNGQNVIPSQKTTEATSNIMVRDGHTIVIGGLFRESTKNTRTQVPLLGNLPYVGTLFRQTLDNTVREEVIILVTPRIIKQAKDEAVSEQLKDDVERFRLGQRKGVRWWGRDRLANFHVRQARQDLADGRRACALWNVDMALSLEPRMEEAIRLKERLTEKAFWADESQFSSAQNIVQRMLMNDIGKPTERNIVPDKPRDPSGSGADVRDAFGSAPRIEDPLPGPAPLAVPGQVEIKVKKITSQPAESGAIETPATPVSGAVPTPAPAADTNAAERPADVKESAETSAAPSAPPAAEVSAVVAPAAAPVAEKATMTEKAPATETPAAAPAADSTEKEAVPTDPDEEDEE